MEENTGNEPLREGGGAGDNVPPGPGNTGENEAPPEEQPKSEMEKFGEMAAMADIDADKLLKEIAGEIEKVLGPKMIDILGHAVDNLNSNMDRAVESKVGPLVEKSIEAQLPGFIQAVEQALLSKYSAMTGGGGGGGTAVEAPTPGGGIAVGGGAPVGGFNLLSFLTNPQAAPAIEAIGKLIRPPQNQNQLAHDFSLLFNGMKMGLNLKVAPEMIDSMKSEFTKIGGGGGATQ
jgi:hypothetical protein